MVVENQGLGENGRLSEHRRLLMQDKALKFRQHIVAIAHRKAGGKGARAFFPEVFRIAASIIEHDATAFCSHAEEIFDEIEAFGQEPELDDDWVDEITGEKDAFYFSTETLVRQAEPLPGLKRGRKAKAPDEQHVVRAVEEAVQSFEQAMAVSHIEQPRHWIEVIGKALTEEGGTADFERLRELTQLSVGALFLGLLLGQHNWTLVQETFYGQVTVMQSR